jgi:hypothetical protein
MNNGQICIKCNVFKLFTEYHTRKDTKLGYRGECKVCRCLRQNKYQKSDAGKAVQVAADQIRNKKYPERRKARSYLNRAVKDGLVTPLPCFICGDKAEAHHPDYSNYLSVVWLCKPHHKQAHQIK